MIKVQFMGPKLYNKKWALFQEESYLPRKFRSSSLNLHTFHVINNVFWWQILFRKHGKSTSNNRQDHHVLVVDVMIMTSQCRCTRAFSQSHIVNHDNHVPVMPLICSGTGCHVHAMVAVWQNQISKNIKNYIQIEAIHPQLYRQLVHDGIKIPGRYNSSWNSVLFFLKSLGPLNCTFTQFILHTVTLTV